MSPKEIQEREAHITRLSDKLLDAVEGEPHRHLIDALVTALVIVAAQHSCCTRAAARAALLAVEHLHNLANTNSETHPSGAHLH